MKDGIFQLPLNYTNGLPPVSMKPELMNLEFLLISWKNTSVLAEFKQ